MSINDFAPAAITYTNVSGKQCALPSLTDAFGLYYNKDMFAKAGIAGPPKTMDELMADAKKLTVRNPDGTIKVAGFVPLNQWEELGPGDLANAWGAKWFDSSGKPQLAEDPGWASAFMWQRQLIDWYGYDNIIKFFAANTNNEFNPSNAFENGKVAMMFDGEWRTAFIKRDSIRRSTTAPRRSRPLPTIPRCTGRPASAGRSSASPRARSTPTRRGCWSSSSPPTPTTWCRWRTASATCRPRTASEASPDLTLPPQFETFLHVWANPKSAFAPPTARRRATATPTCSTTSRTSGRPARSAMPTCSPSWQQLDQQIANDLAPGGGAVATAAPQAPRTSRARRPSAGVRGGARQLRKYGTVLLLLSPWIFGFVVFTAGPMLLSLYYSFTHYDLISSPRWIGLDNYRLHVREADPERPADQGDPYFGTAVRNTLWIIVFGLPLRIFFAIATAMLLTRPKRGVNGYRTLFFMPSMAPTVGASLVFVYLFNPVTGPINQFLGHPWHQRAALVLRPDVGQAGARGARAVGHRRRDRALPGRAAERAARSLRGDLDRGRERLAALPLRDLADADAGDLLHADHRDHRRLPVLRPGLRQRPRPPATASAPRRTRCCSTRSGCTSRRSRYFHMGYASAMAWMLFLATMVLTAILLLTSRRWVHYGGGLS